jgi:hypothetical protein
MKTIKILLAMSLLTSAALAQTYRIDWYVIGSGGGHGESASYELNGTIGQPIVGQGASSSYIVNSGFWAGTGLPPTAGTEYMPGDANMINGQWPPQIIGSDVTFLVGYFRGLNHPCLLDGFYCAGDANGDCLIIGSDVTKMVTYFRGLTTLGYCSDYPPAWLTPGDCPSAAPSGWPNCDVVSAVAKSGPNQDY